MSRSIRLVYADEEEVRGYFYVPYRPLYVHPMLSSNRVSSMTMTMMTD